MIVSQVDVIRW